MKEPIELIVVTTKGLQQKDSVIFSSSYFFWNLVFFLLTAASFFNLLHQIKFYWQHLLVDSSIISIHLMNVPSAFRSEVTLP